MKLIMDSGAYSAFTQGKDVNIQQYADFCLANEKYIDTVVNLDVINPQGPEAAAQSGWDNFLYMKDRGLKTMPVFHAREKTMWLDKMLNETNYVGLSGTSLVSPVENRAWHRFIWSYVTDNQGNSIADFHAFGDTSPWSLLTFPWATCDSATWMIQAGRAGRIKLNGTSFQIRSKKLSDPNFILDSDTGLKRESWEEAIRSLGLDPNKFMTVQARGSELAMLRSFLVAADLLQLEEQSAQVSNFIGSRALLVNKRQPTGGKPRVGPVDMYFVISPSAYYFNYPVLVTLGVKSILVSYYYIATATKGFWEEKLLPFLQDPVGFCQSDPKTKKYWDKLHECVLKPEELAACQQS